MARVWAWLIDNETTRLTASVSRFGRITIQVNGSEVQCVKAGWGMKSTAVALPAAPAELRYGAPFGVGFRCELHVAGKLVLPTSAPKGQPVALTACPHCNVPRTGDGRFCDACGKAQPSPEELMKRAEVQQGNSAIGGLSLLFLLAGVVMYGAQRAATDKALQQIAGHDADAPLAQPIPGFAATTFGELRSQIEWSTWSALLVNLVLAAIMFGLWRWGKSKPGAAIIVAFCTYVVVLVTNAALDPRTIAQGWVVKFIVIAYLFRGLKAALALRNVAPSPA
jgi:hypothetical protein